MTFRVLVTAPYMLPVVDQFMDEFTRHDIEVIKADVQERLEEEQLIPLLRDIDGVICGDDRFTAHAISQAPRLKVIAKWGTGIDSIDAEAATRNGIRICRTPNAFTEPVADSVMGYVLSFARKLPWMDKMMKQGIWDKIPGRALNETTIGVIGVGDVGTAVLRRAHGFGMTLIATDIRNVPQERIAGLGVRMTSLDEVLAEADFISVNCDLNATSRHLLGPKQFARMKKGAIVINTARGPIIDERALVAALQSSSVGGAGLDVFEDEPLPMSSLLRSMDNVLLAPHNSNSSPRAWMKVHLNTISQLIGGLRDQT